MSMARRRYRLEPFHQREHNAHVLLHLFEHRQTDLEAGIHGFCDRRCSFQGGIDRFCDGDGRTHRLVELCREVEGAIDPGAELPHELHDVADVLDEALEQQRREEELGRLHGRTVHRAEDHYR